jgi:hypothetical protein
MKKLVLLTLFVVFSQMLQAQSISAVGAPFATGASMTFDYSGAPGNSTDWIGVYSPGEVPDGDPGSYIWGYINGNTSGTITLDGVVPAGDYVAHLFCCDGYNILASVNFSVQGPTPSSIHPENFPLEGGTVMFAYAGGPGNSSDWIGIYNVGDIPGSNPSIVYQYVTGTEGEITFDIHDLLTPGNYEAHFFCCDGYTILASTTFTVYEIIAPGINPVGMLGQNMPNTFAFTGGTGSLLDWIGIYPHDTIPDGDPPSISYLYVNGANGEVTFDPITELVPGTYYDAHLFCCDGYEILASYTNWTVAIIDDTKEVVEKNSVFYASPMPASEMLQLVFTERVQGKLAIHNLIGQTVRQLSVKGDSYIEVAGLQPGVYTVQFREDKGGQQSIKAVVR